MVILPLSEYVVSSVECFFVWQLTQLQKQNEELRQQGRELRPEGNTHGMLQSEAEHLREVLALALWSLEMTVS
jgi:cell shape-determining protein MreC